MGRTRTQGKAKASARKKVSTPKLKQIQKDESRVLGKVRHYLMTRPLEVREAQYCHPSDMSDPYWCHRRDYYRIIGGEGYVDDRTSARMESVFEEGHSIHRKYQGWLWDVGVLRGVFECLACGELWEDVSPTQCRACKRERPLLRYREVPVFSEDYGIIGHADGDIVEGGPESHDPLLEIKSLSAGTLRFEAPHLLKTYAHRVTDGEEEYSWLDLEGVWRDLRRPFPRHLRQGWLYLFLKDRREMIFLYESKWNQQPKEFVVRRNDKQIESLLDACLDVQYAKKTGRPPSRPGWAEDADGRVCRSCPYRGTCWGVSDATEESEETNDEDEELRRRYDSGKSRSEGTARKRRRRPTSSSSARESNLAERADRPDGRRPDGVVRSPHSLAELLRGAASDSGD